MFLLLENVWQSFQVAIHITAFFLLDFVLSFTWLKAVVAVDFNRVLPHMQLSKKRSHLVYSII